MKLNHHNLKLKPKHGLPANVHVDWVKNIQIILVSFKLFLLIDFTILFNNACVLYLFTRWFQRYCKTLIFLFPRSIADFLIFLSDRIATVFTRSRANRAVALDKSKAFDRVWYAGLLHKLSLTEFHVRYLDLFRLFSVIDSFEWFLAKISVNAGFSQGSILGTTLFLLWW